jgi:hypothetical protein
MECPTSTSVLELGNKAAHFGDIEADMALFKSGYLTPDVGGDRFQIIYHHRHDLKRFPSGYRTTVDKWNLMASLRSSYDLSRAYSPADRFGVVSFLQEI